jgi:hypothetical protein
MFWRRKRHKPVEPATTNKYDQLEFLDKIVEDDPPMDSDYVPKLPAVEKPKSLIELASIRLDMARAKKEEKMAADPSAPAESTYYVLYVYDSETTAVGPFRTIREARSWRHGLEHAGNEEYDVFGIVTGFDASDNPTIIDAELDGKKA